jgi:hypothetical protein
MELSARFAGVRFLRVALAVAAMCAALGIVAMVAFEVPRLERKIVRLPDEKDRISGETELLKTLIQLAGGAVVITGLYFTSRTLYVSQQGQITDRFNKAIEHLGSEMPAVRLGGIYALARIAADSSRDAVTIVEIFASYLRDTTASVDTAVNTAMSSAETRAMFTLLGTAEWARGTPIDLRGCHFAGLQIVGVDLQKSLLDDAVFRECRLPGARFDGGSLAGTDFSGCYLRECSFRGCNVTVAQFPDTSLRKADFSGATVFAANFDAASLLGANFDGATGAMRQHFDTAVVGEGTRLPVFDGLERASS